MSIADYGIIFVIVIAAIGAITFMHRQKKAGKCVRCCGGCLNCSGYKGKS